MPSDFDQIRGFAVRDYEQEMPGLAGATWQLAGQGETDEALRRIQTSQRSMDALRDFGARLGQQQKPSLFQIPAGIDSLEITKDSEGNAQINAKGVDPALIEDYHRSKQMLNEILGSFHQEAARLQAQEQQQTQQPWMQLATALSANLAQARDMPGWVQALGRTAEQLNPPADVLRARRMQVMREEAVVAERAGALDIAAMRDIGQMKKEERTAAEARIRDLLTLEKDASRGAHEGQFEPDIYYKQRIALGDDPKVAEASAQRLSGISNDAKAAAALAVQTKKAEADAKEAQTLQKEMRSEQRWWVHFGKQQQAQEEREIKRESERDKREKEKAGKIGATTEKTIEDILSAKKAGNELLAIFDPNTKNPEYKHFQAIVGPVAGREIEFEKWLGTLNAKDAELAAKVYLQFANAVKTLGAGSYGYRISERGFLMSFTEALKNGAAQNYGNLTAWMAFYNNKIDSIKTLKPDWEGWDRVDAVMNTRPGEKFPEFGKKKTETAAPEFPWKR